MAVTGNKNITIQGQSNTNRATLDANNLHGIFYISESSSVTIRYVNFVDGGNTGRAISAHGTVRIENCNFIGSEGDTGSAIYVYGTATNSIIRNCNFTNNYANNNGANGYTAGGAVCIDNADNVNITNCNFSGNKVLNHGGALVIRNGATNIRITNCNFIKNQAPSGGAIYIHYSSITISNCTFTNNSATNGYGGGIYTTDSIRSTVIGSKFTGNSAKYGGGIYNNATLIVSSSNFVSNKASANGGAIYANKNLNVTGGSITSNTANYGSGIYNIATLRLQKLSLSKNSENPTGMLLNVKTTAKPGTKLNMQAALIKRNNVKGINGIYTTNTNVFNSGKRISISNYAPKQVISFTISGKTYKIKSSASGLAKYSIKTAKKNYKIKITVKTTFNKKTFKKSAIVIVKKATVPTKITNPPSSNSNKKLTVIDEDKVYINSTFNTNQIKKINSKTISYYNVKTANNIVDKYYYRVKNDGWYTGKKDTSGKFTWSKTSKPSGSGNWYNATINTKNTKLTINNKTNSFTSNSSEITLYYFVTVSRSKTSSDLKPYILNTYNITKMDGTSRLVNIYETATTDIYFIGLGVSSKLKNELTHSDSRVQVNDSDFKNLVIKIFQGKTDSTTGIEGLLSADTKIRTIYKWIKKNMDYLGYSNSHYRSTDVLWRMMNKVNGGKYYANCVDQSIFLVTILRTAGVPAHFEHYNSYYSSGYIGHVWVKAYYTNAKTYKLDTTSRRNDVDVINSWTLSKSNSKMPKANPKYKIGYLYAGLVNKKVNAK